MSKLSSLSIVFIVIHITSFLVSSQSPSDTTHTSAITTNVDTICSYGDTGQVIHCNLCSDPSDFRIEHDCIACLDSMWYGLMMILLCSFTLLMSMMLILFHAPMAYRIVSIYLWIQIAAIVFYRASAVFAPIHKRWAFLSTITVFSTSIWKSKCGCHDHVWDQGTSFGIVFIQCVILFMLFFFCTYLHHWFRHSQYSQFTQFARYQYQYQCACKRCYKALINALTVFEKRWQYQGKSNGNNNDEDDGIEDEHGSFVDANPSSPRPGQHPIHPPMTSQLGAPNPSSKGSPTITPVTLEHLKHDTVKKMTSPKPLQLGDNASSQASRPISSTITRSPPQKHLGPPNFKSRMHTPSSNLGTMYTNTDDHDMSAASQSTSNHESYSAIQFQKGKKKHYRHKSISSLTDDHLPTIKEISPVLVAAANNMHSPPSVQSMQSGSVSASGSIPFAMAPPSCVTAEPSTTDHDAKGSQQSMIKKFDNNEGNRLESVVEDQMSPLAIQMHAKDDDMVLTDSMNENMEYKTDVSLLMLAHTPTQSTHNEFDHEEGKTDQHFSFPPQAHAPSVTSQSPSKLHKVMKVQIFKDERAFDYVGADPNAALSDGTYYHMVDLTQNPIHSRSASQFDPSRQNDYPPQVATVFSQTEPLGTKEIRSGVDQSDEKEREMDLDKCDELMEDINEAMDQVNEMNEAMNQPLGTMMNDDEFLVEFEESEESSDVGVPVLTGSMLTSMPVMGTFSACAVGSVDTCHVDEEFTEEVPKDTLVDKTGSMLAAKDMFAGFTYNETGDNQQQGGSTEYVVPLPNRRPNVALMGCIRKEVSFSEDDDDDSEDEDDDRARPPSRRSVRRPPKGQPQNDEDDTKEAEKERKIFEAYNDEDIRITFECIASSKASGFCEILATFSNKSTEQIRDFKFTVKVDAHINLTIKSANGTKLLASSQNSITQLFELINTKYGEQPFVIDFEVAFTKDSTQIILKSSVKIPDYFV
eukprot:1019245_1